MSHLPDLLRQADEHDLHTSPDPRQHGDGIERDETVESPEKNAGSGDSLWREATEALIEPAHALVRAVNEGLEHAGLQLGIIKRRLAPGSDSGSKDAEAQGDIVQPGDPKFSTYLEGKLNEFSRERLQSLSQWTSDKRVSPDYDIDTPKTTQDSRRLNLILYTHQMVSKASHHHYEAILTVLIVALLNRRSCA